MTKRLTDFPALTFDCYGTLIDWESGIWDALQPLLMTNPGHTVVRAAALEAFALEESRQEAETPDLLYPELLRQIHPLIARRLGLEAVVGQAERFGRSVRYWPAFPDTADALRRLKKHFKLVILSNIDRAGFAASNEKLGVEFDAIYTAEDIGSYKPARRNFEHMLHGLDTKFGFGKTEILHTAQSLFHDHVPARGFGLACAWIDRQGLSGSDRWGATARVQERPEVQFRFTSMVKMADAVERES